MAALGRCVVWYPFFMQMVINGQSRDFPALNSGASLFDLVIALALKDDRIAVERNGDIVPRTTWQETAIQDGDRLEIVHFVGGGAATPSAE